MKVILDEREIALYDSCYALLASQKTPSFIVLSKEVLPIGDILIQTDGGKDVLLVERKTFSDMLSSIKDGRYEEQSYRLLHSGGFPPHSIVYLLEGIMSLIRFLTLTQIIGKNYYQRLLPFMQLNVIQIRLLSMRLLLSVRISIVHPKQK